MKTNVVLKKGFERWLKTLGYADTTIYTSVNYVRDFFFYLKEHQINNLQEIKPATLSNYYHYLQTRPNKRTKGALSINTIASNLCALKRFGTYLARTNQGILDVSIDAPREKNSIKTILTQTEIKALYNACNNDVLGIRDRVILGVYYGCGLRQSEGLALNISDILLKDKRIYVRKGKNYKERYVPMSEKVTRDMELYINVGRKELLNLSNINSQALLLSTQSARLCGVTLRERVSRLLNKADINKQIGLHALRHSIATHLLQSGMELEYIGHFLGHASLESTQIYTHICHQTMLL